MQVMTPTLHCLVLMVEPWEGSEVVKPGRHVVRCAVLKTTRQNVVRGADGPVAGATRKEGTVWLAVRSFSPPFACRSRSSVVSTVGRGQTGTCLLADFLIFINAN